MAIRSGTRPSKKLLVADDSLTIQKVIRLALSSGQAGPNGEGYEIQAVSDGNDAIQQISLFRPDAVLIDVSLPGKNAFEVKRLINEHPDLESVRFVLMSSAFEKVDEKQADEVTFHGRLTKPFDPAHLRSILSQIISEVDNRKRDKTVLLNVPEPKEPPQKVPANLPAPEISLSSDFDDGEGDGNEIGYIDPAPSRSAPKSGKPLFSFDPPPPEVLTPEAEAPALEFPKKYDSETDLEEFNQPLSPSPAPQNGQSANGGQPQDSDIKELTESTIRMSGLDDFQWNVEEPAKTLPEIEKTQGTGLNRVGGNDLELLKQKIPQVPPLPAMSDLSQVTFSLDDRTGSGQESRNPETPPAHQWNQIDPPFDADRAEVTEHELSFDPPEFDTGDIPTLNAPGATPGAAQVSALPISESELENIIRKQIQETLGELTRKILPEIAERVIRQEIHRMLEEGSKDL